MGAESSSLHAVESLNHSLETIEKQLFTIEDLLLHHQHTTAINNNITISGIPVPVNESINFLCGPIISAILPKEVRFLVELNQSATLSCVVFHKNPHLFTKDRFYKQYSFQLSGKQPKLCTITDLEPSHEYIIYIGGVNKESIYHHYLEITTLSENSSDNLDVITIQPEDFHHPEMVHRFLNEFLYSKQHHDRQAEYDPKSFLSSTNQTKPMKTKNINDELPKTKCIIQKFSYQPSFLSFFRIQLIEFIQLLRNSNFSLPNFQEKLIRFEDEIRQYYRSFFQTIPLTHSNKGSKENQGIGGGEAEEVRQLLQSSLNRYCMQIFFTASHDEISMILLEFLQSLATPVPLATANTTSASSKQRPSTSGTHPSQRQSSILPSSTQPSRPSSVHDIDSRMVQANSVFLQDLFSAVVDEKRTQTQLAFQEITNAVKELDHMFLSMIARLVRRIHWMYFRQLWDENYESLNRLDNEREELLRSLFWYRRENLGKIIFRQRLLKLQYSPNTFGSQEHAILNKDIEMLKLKCQEVAGSLANSMNRMPTSNVGQLVYRAPSTSIIVIDDCFQYLLQDGLMTFEPSKQREINSQIFEHLDEVTESCQQDNPPYSQTVLVISIFPFIKNELKTSKPLPITSPISFHEQLSFLQQDSLSSSDSEELLTKLFQLKYTQIEKNIIMIISYDYHHYHGISKIIPIINNNNSSSANITTSLKPWKNKEHDFNYEEDFYIYHIILENLSIHHSKNRKYLDRPWFKYIQKKYLQQQQQSTPPTNTDNLPTVDNKLSVEEFRSVLQPSTISIQNSVYYISYEAIHRPATTRPLQRGFRIKAIPLNRFVHSTSLQSSSLSPFNETNSIIQSGIHSVNQIIILKVTDNTAQVLFECNYHGLVTLECRDNLTGISYLSQQMIQAYQPKIFYFQYLYPQRSYSIYYDGIGVSSKQYLGSFVTFTRSDIAAINAGILPHAPQTASLSAPNSFLSSPMMHKPSEMTGLRGFEPSDTSSHQGGDGGGVFGNEVMLVLSDDTITSSLNNLGFANVMKSAMMKNPLTEIKLIIHSSHSFDWSSGILAAIAYYQQAELYHSTTSFTSTSTSALHHPMMQSLDTTAPASSYKRQERYYRERAKEQLQQQLYKTCFLNTNMRELLAHQSHYFLLCPILVILTSLHYSSISDLYLDYSPYTIHCLLSDLDLLMTRYFSWYQQPSEEGEGRGGLGERLNQRTASAFSLPPLIGGYLPTPSVTHLHHTTKITTISSVLFYEITPLLSNDWNNMNELFILEEEIQTLHSTLFSTIASPLSTQTIQKVVILSAIPLLRASNSVHVISSDQNEVLGEERLGKIHYNQNNVLSLLTVCAEWLYAQTPQQTQSNNESGSIPVLKEVSVICGYDAGCRLSDILVEFSPTAILPNSQSVLGSGRVGGMNNSHIGLPSSLEGVEKGGKGIDGVGSQYHNLEKKIIRQICCGPEGLTNVLRSSVYRPYYLKLSSNALYRFSVLPMPVEETIVQHSIEKPSTSIGIGEQLFEDEEDSRNRNKAKNDDDDDDDDVIFPLFGVVSFRPSISSSISGAGTGGTAISSPSLPQAGPSFASGSMTKRTEATVGGKGGAKGGAELNIPNYQTEEDVHTSRVITLIELEQYLPDWKTLLEEGKAIRLPPGKYSLTSPVLLYKRHYYLLLASIQNITVFHDEIHIFSNQEDIKNIPLVMEILIQQEEEYAVKTVYEYLIKISQYNLLSGQGIPIVTNTLLQEMYDIAYKSFFGVARQICRVPSNVIVELVLHHLRTVYASEAPVPRISANASTASHITVEQMRNVDLFIGQQLLKVVKTSKEGEGKNEKKKIEEIEYPILKDVLKIGFQLQLLSEEISRELFI